MTKILEMTLFTSKDSTINEICELYYNIILLTVISYKKEARTDHSAHSISLEIIIETQVHKLTSSHAIR